MNDNEFFVDYKSSIKTILHLTSTDLSHSEEVKYQHAINNLVNGKRPVPNIGHFVWIGDLHDLDVTYINIWKATNRHIQFHLWYHREISLCMQFHHFLRSYVIQNSSDNWEDALIAIQNEAFDFIYPRIDLNHDFNDLVIDFLRMKNLSIFDFGTIPDVYPFSSIGDIIYMSVNELFEGEFLFFKKIYYYEVILRGNLACASDVVRLIALYKHGGIYLDVDTLPFIDHIFSSTNFLIKDMHLQFGEFIDAAKAHAFLDKIASREINGTNYLQSLYKVQNQNIDSIASAIFKDVENVTLADIPPLSTIYCYPDFIALSSLKYLPSVYFSNVICSHPGSRLIRILLRVIKKRYLYLLKRNAVFVCFRTTYDEDYLGRLLPYRYESLIKSSTVTLSLTGPGVIFEVLLGLGYQLFKIDEAHSPDFLARLIQNDSFGIAFFEHTLYTPSGLISTWFNEG